MLSEEENNNKTNIKLCKHIQAAPTNTAARAFEGWEGSETVFPTSPCSVCGGAPGVMTDM